VRMAVLAWGPERALGGALATRAFAAPLSRRPPGLGAVGEARECRHYPVANAAAPAPLAAPFSYVVRYHRPAEDEAAFIANYVATHPPTLARLPAIRNVLCYFPLDRANPAGPVQSGYILGHRGATD